MPGRVIEVENMAVVLPRWDLGCHLIKKYLNNIGNNTVDDD